MGNLFFIKAEIIIFIVSFFYICYYFWERLFTIYLKFKQIVSPRKKEKKISIHKRGRKIDIWKSDVSPKEKNLNDSCNQKKSLKDKDLLDDITSKQKLNDAEKQKIIEILKKVKVNSLKWYFDTSRGLIIEWLAIDKFNKDLNLELAFIYEKENKFQNAEYIYRDLSDFLQDDFELKKKLAFNLAMQNKFDDSIKIYEEIHKSKKSDNDVVSMLTDLTYDAKKYKKCLKYVNLFLKEKPRNVEKMFMKCVCLESKDTVSDWKWEKDLIQIYKKILEIQPYNTAARDRIKELIRKLEKSS
jgi:tetratricopeptide (TPR) repeat protein